MGSEGKNSGLRPWEDEEGRRKEAKRGASIPEKTGIKSKVHSKPPVKGQEYLDMYMMLKEKKRMENYGDTLSKHCETVAENWKDLKGEIIKQEKNLPEVPKGGLDETDELNREKSSKILSKTKTPKNMKKMDWNY